MPPLSLASAAGSPTPLAAGVAHHAAAPTPVTRAYPHSRQGTLPPNNPPQNIPPNPNFLSSCSGTHYDNSSGCVNATLQAIANAREQEGLPGMDLPTDWNSLSPEQQEFVVTNLERTVRGLPPLSAMASALDQSSAQGAAQNQDPEPPGGFPWTTWGSNWAGAVGNSLEAMYFWMYDDGLGSSNIDCTQSNQSGCWGHRDNVLINLNCNPCLMGTGYNATAWQGDPSWAELLVDTSGSPQLDFSWNSVLPYLPGDPGGASLTAPAVGIASTPDGGGYWLVSADGGVFSFGDAQFYNSMAGHALGAPVVDISSTPDGKGYWLVGADGGIFSFGDAGYYGSMGGHPLARPVVGIAPTRDGRGYWEVASDGGIFAFGDAGFTGSMGGHPLARPVVGIAPTSDGRGYWEVASDGGIFAFGDAPFYGSTGHISLYRPVVGMQPTPDGRGYWMTGADGGIFAFGDAPFHGSTGGQNLNAPVVSMAAPSNAGYWLAAADGGIFSFGVPFHGSMG
ncbi:MAG: spore germination YkwD domain-containing protein [Acidimicrobiales bacterium]